MRTAFCIFFLTLASLCLTACNGEGEVPADQEFDLVLEGGRVMDPETGLDAVRNVGISDGRIAAISEEALQGDERIDASGLVVAPGFIDLHAHGQDAVSNRLQAMDGVTTALEMEAGVYPVGKWLASREGKAAIHYGATAGHWPARVKLVDGLEVGHFPTLPEAETTRMDEGNYAYEELSPDQIEELTSLLEQGLNEGGLGLGFGITYTPGASRLEIYRLFQMAARRGVATYVHLRGENSGGTLGAFQEAIALAASTGASTHIVHMNSSAGEWAEVTLGMIRGAQERGLDVTTESYPYTAGSTRIESALFDPWEGRCDEEYQRLQWPATGERLTRETFEKYRKQGGWVIIHGRSEETNEWIVAQPDVMAASDGIPYLNGPAHPRGAGTFARILGHYVREQGALTLMDALGKMTLLPARRVEGAAPVMKRKGRVQEGADADLTLFDPETVIDRSTYEDGDLPSGGIVHVLVGGTFVVRDSEFIEGVFPGQAIRGGE
ncbi:MAG TPA: amidohydrolase family protein [Acidobacteriota bacterium]|nr:amidohydrolase family protein [Acidobacteriota bacterium]